MTGKREFRALVMDDADNVATALTTIPAGTKVDLSVGTVEVPEDIDFGHKFALRPIDQGDYIVKYGAHVGIATAPIPKGRHVHVHNVRDVVDEVRHQKRTVS